MISRNYIIALIIAVILLLTAGTAFTTILDDSSKDIEDTGKDINDGAGCVFENIENSEKCDSKILGDGSG